MLFSAHSKSNTRFLVAKYIRDMHRLEPRNIGVVVWTNGVVSARFLGESQSETTDVNAPRRLGVRDQDMYRQWIHYWREQMSSSALSANGNGHQVPRESPDFLDALKQRSKRQFVLVDGGFISGDVDTSEIDEVVHDLFEALVDDRPENREVAEEESVLLKKAIGRAFADSGIDTLSGYSTRLPLTFKVDGHALGFTFDSGVYIKRPVALFQHAMLTRPMSVNSAAFGFNCICRADDNTGYRLGRERCIALVRASQQVMDLPNVPNELEKLKAYGTVIDLADHDQAVQGLKSLATDLMASCQ